MPTPESRILPPVTKKHLPRKNSVQIVQDFFISAPPAQTNGISQTTYLKPNSRFRGIQQSGKSTYEVEVTLKSVDFANSFCSGFLKIKGLTEEYSEISTYFKSEIIGNSKYTFVTENSSWGSTYGNDITHWKQLTNNYTQTDEEFLEYLQSHSKSDFLSNEYVFMRWKEEFLVPDAKVTNIKGASFEGFYYILLNQKNGVISGLYYHKSSERFQQLSLEYVNDFGLHSSFEFV